ncbi:hypothetical protein DIPPA_19432 [Diplonema papillatum]|nr:hypothetical protein DIPPA_19432 [Diplonema papillatum]
MFRGGVETMEVLETQLKTSRHAFTSEAWMDLFPTYRAERAGRATRWAYEDATGRRKRDGQTEGK